MGPLTKAMKRAGLERDSYPRLAQAKATKTRLQEDRNETQRKIDIIQGHLADDEGGKLSMRELKAERLIEGTEDKPIDLSKLRGDLGVLRDHRASVEMALERFERREFGPAEMEADRNICANQKAVYIEEVLKPLMGCVTEMVRLAKLHREFFDVLRGYGVESAGSWIPFVGLPGNIEDWDDDNYSSAVSYWWRYLKNNYQELFPNSQK